MKTWKQLAQEALDVQNACNATAVAMGMHRAMVGLGELGIRSTDDKNVHPITLLWLDKLNSLAGTQCLCERSRGISEAYDWAYKLLES